MHCTTTAQLASPRRVKRYRRAASPQPTGKCLPIRGHMVSVRLLCCGAWLFANLLCELGDSTHAPFGMVPDKTMSICASTDLPGAIRTSICFEDPLAVLAKLNSAMARAAAAISLAACNSSSNGSAPAIDPASYSTCTGITSLPGGTAAQCAMTMGDLTAASGLTVTGLTVKDLNVTVAQTCRELCGLCPDPVASGMSRSIAYLGWPLRGYSERPKENSDQQIELNKFWERIEEVYQDKLGMKAGTMPKKSALRNEAHYGSLRVWYWGFAILQVEFQRVSYDDLMYTTASILFVLGYIMYHTGSAFLGCMGMAQIVLTLPAALFFYRIVFMIPFFNQLHILAIYLVLGIGADDIFVFVDAWKQSSEHYSHSADRMDYTWRRASKAMLVTSTTTVAAFLATAISPIMPISSFAIYASIGIVLNCASSLSGIMFVPSINGVVAECCQFSRLDIFCVTFYPTIVMIHHRRLYGCLPMCSCSGRKVACCCAGVDANKSRQEDDTDADQAAAVQQGAAEQRVVPAVQAIDDSAQKKDPQELIACYQCYKCLYSEPVKAKELQMMKAELCCTNCFAPLVARKWIAVCMVVFLGIYAVVMGIVATGMEPPSEQEEWFPEDHMYQQFASKQDGVFLASAGNDYISVSLAWGLKGMNRDDTNRWKPQERGTVEFDSNFDLSTEAAQRHLISACAAARTEPCALPGCEGTAGTLIRQDSLDCWPETFVNWWRVSSCAGPTEFPTGALFLPAITSFRRANYRAYGSDIGLIGGELKYVRLQCSASLRKQQPNRLTQPVIEAFDAFMDKIDTGAPTEMAGMIHGGGVFWTWTWTERALVDGIFTGFAICFPCAFLVLIASTWNIVTSLWAILTVAAIVACVLGSVKAFFGWGLGIAESIAAVIVIGLSVDYAVHLAHMYSDANDEFVRQGKALPTREERVRYAIRTMGVTVLAGAVTTGGAGFFLQPCQIIFFVKFSVLIMGAHNAHQNVHHTPSHIVRNLVGEEKLWWWCAKGTIFFSLLFANVFFMAGLSLFGPTKNFGTLPRCSRGKTALEAHDSSAKPRADASLADSGAVEAP